jgi:plasmid stabilization system protein ParE
MILLLLWRRRIDPRDNRQDEVAKGRVLGNKKPKGSFISHLHGRSLVRREQMRFCRRCCRCCSYNAAVAVGVVRRHRRRPSSRRLLVELLFATLKLLQDLPLLVNLTRGGIGEGDARRSRHHRATEGRVVHRKAKYVTFFVEKTARNRTKRIFK